ncbi:Acid ceramidase [Portunus trituberculatus]|uniref:ceramidase n=1 Tax=Portunus trituberculatus TaxID=210409 RepID=A0A5B7KAZ7_PORTR|nr:Acid ceramidase [Portunus trituberculatus]
MYRAFKQRIVFPQQMEALIDDVTQLVQKLFGERVLQFLLSSLSEVTSTLPEPYKEEIEGISSATGLPVSTVTLYNIFYEIFTFCTSLVVQDPAGHLYHARNLDTGVLLGLVSFGLVTHTTRSVLLLKRSSGRSLSVENSISTRKGLQLAPLE